MSHIISTAFIGLIIILNVFSAKTEDITTNPGLKTLVRVYDDCQKAEYGLQLCLKKKAITFLRRVGKVNAIKISDGLKFIRSDESQHQTLSDNELEHSLPRSSEARNLMLNNLLSDQVATLLSNSTIQIQIPKISSNVIGRAMEEGRGKMKKMMGMMMMGFMMKMAAMVPVAISALYILAGKALIVSKIALLLAAIIGLKKLVSSKHGSSGGGNGGGWSSGQSQGWSQGSGQPGGWDKRSSDSHDIIYAAQKPQ